MEENFLWGLVVGVVCGPILVHLMRSFKKRLTAPPPKVAAGDYDHGCERCGVETTGRFCDPCYQQRRRQRRMDDSQPEDGSPDHVIAALRRLNSAAAGRQEENVCRFNDMGVMGVDLISDPSPDKPTEPRTRWERLREDTVDG